MMEKQAWFKESIKSTGVVCMCCGGTAELLPLETKLYAAGWRVTKDGKTFFQEQNQNIVWENNKDINFIESLIPDNDNSEYLAIVYLALRGATYQRHAKNNWVLVEQNEGYA